MSGKQYNNKDWLYRKYTIEKLSTVQIAEMCKCGRSTIGGHLKKFSIEIRTKGEANNPNAKWSLLNNKDWLTQKYIDEKLNVLQIAKICNCDNRTVGDYLKKFSIEMRSGSECQNPNANWTLLNDKKWLKQKYGDEKLTTYQIAKLCNCSHRLVNTQLKKFNIEIRSLSKSQNPNANWTLLNDKGWLNQKYVDEKLSTVQIAEMCSCSHRLVGTQLKYFGIKIREIKGENHPCWKGGISFEPYCYKFNDDIKEETRDKFNRICFICGKEENGKKLSVHHVDYNKGQGCGHKWSLIPLCSSCHAKTNHNRYFWFNLLQNYWLMDDTKNFNNLTMFNPKTI